MSNKINDESKVWLKAFLDDAVKAFDRDDFENGIENIRKILVCYYNNKRYIVCPDPHRTEVRHANNQQ